MQSGERGRKMGERPLQLKILEKRQLALEQI